MLHLASNGFRCIAHDRRGHGRSSQPWHGNEMDTYADDLATLIDALDLKDAVLIGFSTGGGEVARYIGRHGTKRVGEGGAHLGGAAADAEDGGQPGRAARSRCSTAFAPPPSPTGRSSIRTSRAARSSDSTGPAQRRRKG